MIRSVLSLVRFSPRLLAVLIVCLAPAGLRAETVMFRNECPSTVIVQTATLVRGVLRRDQACLLRYGECTPRLTLDADKVVSIYDGKTNRILFRDVLKVSKKPLYYSIVVERSRVQVKFRTKTPPSLPGPQP